MRLQIALNVSDLEAAIDFYSRLFGTEVNKKKPGYANFSIEQPPLKLVLFEQPDMVNQLNHLGVEVFDDAEIEAAATQMAKADLIPEREEAEVCCFARQNKAIAYDPDGTMWEWYRVLADSDSFFDEAEKPAVCC
jgi:catechol 2,3-dioxygenase-like lactoylglutathione lyase family enzyme